MGAQAILTAPLCNSMLRVPVSEEMRIQWECDGLHVHCFAENRPLLGVIQLELLR